ncbi:MAG: aminomethyltransferase family protein [Pseudomonadota bacterium]
MSATAFSPLERYFARRGVSRIEVTHGIATPKLFTDPAAEHMATRRAAGLFDFSFMTCIGIEGRDSLALLHRLQTRNLASLQDQRLAYSLLLRENGTVINDVTIWRIAADRYLLFTGRHDDLQHLAPLADGLAVSIDDRSREQSVLAVQGKQAWAIIKRCFSAHAPGLPQQLPYYGFVALTFDGNACLLARIGYSGETGYELVIAADAAPGLWDALLRAGADRGIAECGFSAIDTLRIEAGHILFARELALPVTPFEIGLARLVDFYNAECAGIAALRRTRWQAPARALAGLMIDERAAELTRRADADLSAVAKGSALLTSVCLSPVLRRRIGLGFVAATDRRPGTRVRLEPGVSARVARLPFYDPGRFLARRTR